VAVKETVAAASYLAKQRRRLRGVFGHSVGLALSAQGVELAQYLLCAEQIVPLLEPGDLFALGGAPVCPPATRCRGLERCRHVTLTRQWLANFRAREPGLYREWRG
jgi:hypothetical protein